MLINRRCRRRQTIPSVEIADAAVGWMAIFVTAASVALHTGGCSSSVRVTDPDRSATEQFLISTAASKAVSQLGIEPLRGRMVYLETRYFAASDQVFVIGELRARMLLGGVHLTTDRELAEIVMELRSGGVGVDRSDLFVGIPPLLLSTSVGGDNNDDTVPLATPEVSLVKNIDQRGVASVAYVAYWRDNGEIAATSGPYVGYARRKDWWYFGMGRGTVGDIPPTELPAE
jgi:hypothetical protein